MRKTSLFVTFLLLATLAGFGQTGNQQTGEKVVTFKFLAQQDMFYIPYGGNDAELNRLYSLVDEYRTEITAGRLPVYVDGYCASLTGTENNLRTAAVRSNRVKSELITNKGLSEEHFITRNHAAAYEGQKDMVVVTLRIPAKAEEPDNARLEQERREREAAERARREQAERERAEREKAERERAEAERAAREQAEKEALQAQTTTIPEPAAPVKPYCFAIRTNLLYDAFLLPTLGVEWRIDRNIGIKLDGSYSYWGDEHGKVQKMWLINPEVRWYLLNNKRFYLGVGGNYGKYNTYGYLLGSFYPETDGYNGYKGDTGYQGELWNAGLTIGYQLYLSRSFSLDFNLGLGYTSLEYDSFNVIDKTRVYNERNQSKNFWGPTQAGINLVWTIGGNK